MPWEHCGLSVHDDEPCPRCGKDKKAWTVKLDRTRLFALAPDTWEGDAEAQAEALKEAARQGTPLCEECEKLRQQQRA